MTMANLNEVDVAGMDQVLASFREDIAALTASAAHSILVANDGCTYSQVLQGMQVAGLQNRRTKLDDAFYEEVLEQIYASADAHVVDARQ